LVARLRPTDCNDRFELLYWSLWKNQWAPAGPFGRTVLSIDDALRFIAPGGYLLVYDVTARQMELRKVEVRWSPKFGQVVKLGLLLRRTDLNDGQTKAVFGGFQGEGCS
jgi:hypothetical protein